VNYYRPRGDNSHPIICRYFPSFLYVQISSCFCFLRELRAVSALTIKPIGRFIPFRSRPHLISHPSGTPMKYRFTFFRCCRSLILPPSLLLQHVFLPRRMFVVPPSHNFVVRVEPGFRNPLAQLLVVKTKARPFDAFAFCLFADTPPLIEPCIVVSKSRPFPFPTNNLHDALCCQTGIRNLQWFFLYNRLYNWCSPPGLS